MKKFNLLDLPISEQPKEIKKIGELTCGGLGGVFYSLEKIEGETLVFYGGTHLDSLRIGSKQYGGNGGSEQTKVVLPDDGLFDLLVLETQTWSVGQVMAINYLEAKINGKIVAVGTNRREPSANLSVLKVKLRVKLTGIRAGDIVDALYFDIFS